MEGERQDSGGGRGAPLPKFCVLTKNIRNNLCGLYKNGLANAGAVCYTIGTLNQRGGVCMLNFIQFAFDDVDDLIFLDTSWNHSER